MTAAASPTPLPRLSLPVIARAAGFAFTEGGYRLTQIAHVAAYLGVSVGAIYRYVDGKEALFEASLLECAELLDPDGPLPRRAMTGGALDAALKGFFSSHAHWPQLREAVLASSGDASAIAAELFDLLLRWAPLVRLLERCARDRPDLMDMFETGLRRPYMEDLSAWAAHALQGDAKAIEAIARGAMEAVSWLAIRRPYDATGRRISDPDARAAAIALMRGALALE